jgi:hypothetical protein
MPSGYDGAREGTMVRLDDLVGRRVLLSLINSSADGYRVILHGVEYGGIWVESKRLEKLIGYRKPKATGLKPATKPVFFVPYAQIGNLVAYSTEL